MKVGIIGCSHSAGVSQAGLLNKAGGFNAWRGWPRQLAKKFPQHEIHLFASPGGGQNNMEAALRTCLVEDYEMVILQFTTQRQMYPLTIERKSKNYDGTLDSWFRTGKKENFFLHQQKMKSLSVKNYVVERKCVMVGPHWDHRMGLDLEGTKVNANELPQVILEALIDNEYFNEMAETFYNCRNMYKKLFKHFFSMLWVPTYKHGPTNSDQALIEVEGKVPVFVEKFLTGKELTDQVDWKTTIYDWLVEYYSKAKSPEDANRIIFHEYRQHKGHLGEKKQHEVLNQYLLKHNEFYGALVG